MVPAHPGHGLRVAGENGKLAHLEQRGGVILKATLYAAQYVVMGDCRDPPWQLNLLYSGRCRRVLARS